jgi:hypothetical protein
VKPRITLITLGVDDQRSLAFFDLQPGFSW